MKRSHIHRSIERYLDGKMSAGERQAFEEAAVRDPELAEMLRAEEMIRSAVTRERASMRMDESRLRTHLSAVLEGLPVHSPLPSALVGKGAALGTSLVKTIGTVIGVLGVVGVSFFLFTAEPDEHNIRSGSAVGGNASPSDTREMVNPAEAQEERGIDAVMNRGGSPQDAVGTSPRETGGRLGNAAELSTTGDREGRVGNARDVGSEGSAVLSSDTVRVKVKVNMRDLGKDGNR
ncbi:MAG: hypothetical protein QHI48_11715 [Bacteroidota bacterium]|nr:hypothetical protein [Bacteroidota bacterium]